MDVTTLLAPPGAAPVRFALTGAKGGYARTLLAQARQTPHLIASVLCDLDVDGLASLCNELGYEASSLVEASTPDDLDRAAASGQIALIRDIALLENAPFDVLVEATGSPLHGTAAARTAIRTGRHVVMVSKEVDTVSGPSLADAAQREGLVYTLAHGDQPANLLDLIGWARLVGFDIVAAGKSSEYDLVYDPEAGTISQLDEVYPIDTDAFNELLTLDEDISATLHRRAEAVSAFTRSAAADLCEMTAVAVQSGLIPDTELFHYPVARIDELADVYALEADGGVLSMPGRIDVFSALRVAGEASFAGGEFVVVRTHDETTWETLRQKGHVISRSGAYACIYLPFHLMGVETVTTILAAARLGIGTGVTARAPGVVLAGRASRDLPAGTVLVMGGHHHEISGVTPVVLPREGDTAAPANTAPFYLAAHTTLARDVVAGTLLTFDDLADAQPELLDAWSVSLTLPPFDTPTTRLH